MLAVDLTPPNEIDRTRPIAPQVYDYLRRRIVDNRLKPGMRISEAVLANQLEISRTPLRAALQQLANEGLITIRPQVGTVVAKLDNTQLSEAVFIRSALEAAVVEKLANERADLSSLEPILAIQKMAAERDDYAAFFGQDEAFHAMLAELSGMPNVWKVVQSVKGHVDRQRYTMMAAIKNRSQRAYEEHMEVVAKIRAGDTAGAVQTIKRHVESVLEVEIPDVEKNREKNQVA